MTNSTFTKITKINTCIKTQHMGAASRNLLSQKKVKTFFFWSWSLSIYNWIGYKDEPKSIPKFFFQYICTHLVQIGTIKTKFYNFKDVFSPEAGPNIWSEGLIIHLNRWAIFFPNTLHTNPENLFGSQNSLGLAVVVVAQSLSFAYNGHWLLKTHFVGVLS